MFTSLHLLFEQRYTELALAVDLIAERVRALGARALVYSAYAALTEIKEDQGVTKAETMIRELLNDQGLVIRNARATCIHW